MKVQVVHDIEQYDCVLKPLEDELLHKGITIVNDANADASVICQVYEAPPNITHPCFVVFHGVSVFKHWIKNYDKFRYVDYVVLPGRIWELITKGSKRVKTLPLGWTKADVLLSGNQKASRQYISDKFNLSKDRPIILYAPTYHGKNRMKGQDGRFGEILKNLSEYDVLFAPHQISQHYADFVDYRLFINPKEDKIPYLLGCDLVISDVSSISIEASLIDKPIVLLDNPKYSDYLNLKVSHSTTVLNVGERATIENLGDAVETTLECPNAFAKHRKYWREEVLGYGLDGKSTIRIVDAIIKCSNL